MGAPPTMGEQTRAVRLTNDPAAGRTVERSGLFWRTAVRQSGFFGSAVGRWRRKIGLGRRRFDRWGFNVIEPSEAANQSDRVEQLPNGKWRAYLHGTLVAGADGQAINFDCESDARAFLEEAEARASSIDS